jgi:hypothetical protein
MKKFRLGSRVSLLIGAPAIGFRQLRLRPIDRHLAATEINRTTPTVDRDPVTFFDRPLCKLRTMPVRVHRQFSATNNARPIQLTRYQSRVRGPAADRRYDAGCNCESRNVCSARVVADKDNGITAGREPRRAMGTMANRALAPFIVVPSHCDHLKFWECRHEWHYSKSWSGRQQSVCLLFVLIDVQIIWNTALDSGCQIARPRGCRCRTPGR